MNHNNKKIIIIKKAIIYKSNKMKTNPSSHHIQNNKNYK